MEANTVIIVEDISDTLKWLIDMVSEVFPETKIDTATTLTEARSLQTKNIADLFLIDLGLPDGSGLEFIKEIRSDRKDMPYIVVTTIFDDRDNLKQAFQFGANGYLLKDDGREETLVNLKGLIADRAPLSSRSLDQLLDEYRPDEKPEVELTQREESLLQLIASGRTVAEAAEHLGLTRNTVKGYLKTVYAKLGISSRAEATSEAIKRKLLVL
ncbi:MAG: response regulator transcription factor [Pseudomonadales bacterium]|nr:response regulator transcription factor [Pseudomonadales bacterium]MBO6594923.1 response regulator transcription factor [Pseudomonadales bacterium]MBO6658277.1 response regulator transcription factor [Pseudomonadales bacterium]MBO6821518.1 response regulator transcription factor [Pseudomonadales bacterium]